MKVAKETDHKRRKGIEQQAEVMLLKCYDYCRAIITQLFEIAVFNDSMPFTISQSDKAEILYVRIPVCLGQLKTLLLSCETDCTRYSNLFYFHHKRFQSMITNIVGRIMRELMGNLFL